MGFLYLKLPQLGHNLYFTSKPPLDFYVYKHSQMKLTVQTITHQTVPMKPSRLAQE